MILFPQNITATDYTFTQNKMTITSAAGTPYTIQADIQPATGDDEGNSIDSSPQGRKQIGLVKVYSNQKLTVPIEGTQTRGTILDWNGQKWEVIQELPYQKGTIFSIVDHYKYYAQLLVGGEL